MKIHLPLIFCFCCAGSLEAAVVGYWRFESGAFLADSSGNGHDLTNGSGNAAAAAVSLPGTGAGSAYPGTIPLNGLSNGSAAGFDGGDLLSTPDSPAFATTTMTIEAFVTVGTATGNTATIAGQLEGSGTNRSFLLALTSTGVPTFIFNSGSAASTLPALVAGKDYYIAVTVNMADTSANGITFYLQNLTDGGALQTSSVTHSGTTLNNSTAAFTIGSTATPSSQWNGLIDEVRFSNTKLTADQLLIAPEAGSVMLAAAGMGGLALRRRR